MLREKEKGKYVLVDEGLTGEKVDTKSSSCIVGSQEIISKLESGDHSNYKHIIVTWRNI